jgi:short-subunit dehydrogenase
MLTASPPIISPDTTTTHDTVLVTGASGGIGEQLARRFATRGSHLVLSARSASRLDALNTELTTAHPGSTVDVITADLSFPAGPAALVEHLTAAGITVDVLVNCAGIGSHGPFAAAEASAVSAQIQLNCTSLVELTSRLLPGMLTRGHGGILNIASTSAFQPTPTMAVYGATKAFVLSFTEALWVETRHTGVRVLAVCPGPTETGFFQATGQQFLRKGRQSAEEVATVAVHAFYTGHSPSVISGAANRLSATGYRILPRAVMARVAGARVQ